jgi:chloramphenicol 3-O phosphotransferase
VGDDERGRVILLNGPSSSGKSSIGRHLLPLLEEPWFHVPIDAVSGMRSTEHRRELDDAGIAAMLRRTRRGYHRVVAALAATGNDVVMDYPLSEEWRLHDLLDVLDGYDVTLVDIHCSPAELTRRERARGDRPAGLAASQRVYEHGDRDLTVDTTATSPEDCAAAIVRGLDGLPREKAFDRLRRARGDATGAAVTAR